MVDPGDGDRAIGFIDAKDVLRAGETDASDTVEAADIAHEILAVPETTAIDDPLVQFRDDRQQMAAVIDEWGAFEGIATAEDVVEAVVGDLRDEFDADGDEPSIRSRGDGRYDTDGSVALSAVNDALGAAFESHGFGTIGGLVFDRLGRAPDTGDRIEAVLSGGESSPD